MTQVAILLTALAAAPSPSAKVLVNGRCLLRVTPGSRVTLAQPPAGGGCAVATLKQGQVRILAPKGKSGAPAMTVVLGKHRVGLTGDVHVRRDGVTGLCVHRGSAQLKVTPTASPAPATPGAAPSPRPTVVTAKAGQCLWLTASGATVGAYTPKIAARDKKATGTDYDFASPKVVLKVDLLGELKGLSAALHRGAGAGADVDGGGQSMCLETGGEGSAADLGSTGVEVTKPPPPTQLRLILTLERRAP